MPKREPSAAFRGIWSGTLSFGLVSVPVSLFPAVRRRPVHLRMLAEDGTPLARQYVCPEDGKVLEGDDLVRGYELEDGKLVIIRDEELEAIAPEMTRDISLKEFVDVNDIAPAHFDRPYFLAPSGGSTNAYRLLARVMEERKRAGIATFVMRGKEHLVAILAKRGLLMAETLRFLEELRDPEEIGLPERKAADRRRVETFQKAIASLSRKRLDDKELSDRYAARFERLVKTKRKSRKAVVQAEVEDEESGKIIDLAAIFKQRMRAAQAAEEAEDRGGTRPAGELEALSKEELYERAKALEIPGRSKMSKRELARALSA